MLIFWLVINTPVILTAQWNELNEMEIDEINENPSKFTTK
jgi:hypothetical protein